MSPRTKHQNEQLRASTRKKILDASLDLFARQGYENVSIDEIATKAGISKGLVYNHFSSKEDLLKTTLQVILEEGEQEFAVTNLKRGKDLFTQLLDTFFQTIRERNEYWRLVTLLALQMGKHEFVNELGRKKYRSYTRLTKHMFEAMNIPDAEEEAQILGAIFDGIALQYEVLGEEVPLENIRNHLIKKYVGND
jgi:AcrR family transcriptional regulator